MNSLRLVLSKGNSPSLLLQGEKAFSASAVALQGQVGRGERVHEGKVGVITCGARGLGYHITERLTREGCKIVFGARSQGSVDKAIENLTKAGIPKDVIKGFAGDSTKRGDLKNMMSMAKSTFGGIDYMVSSLGVDPAFGKRALDLDDETWDSIFENNMHGAYLASQEVYPHMLERKSGVMVYVSSISAYHKVMALRPQGAYGVSMTGLIAISMVMSDDLAHKNIRCNTVCPGFYKTGYLETILAKPELAAKLLKEIGLERWAEPQEIASVCCFLLSKDSSYITGENIVVAGGMPSHL